MSVVVAPAAQAEPPAHTWVTDETGVSHLVATHHLTAQRRRRSRVVRTLCGLWVILGDGETAWAGCRDCRLRAGIVTPRPTVRSHAGRLVVPRE